VWSHYNAFDPILRECGLGRLAKFESVIAQFVEGTFGRLFSGTLQPMEVASALARAIEDHHLTDDRGRVIAPNVFWVYLHPADYDTLRAAQPSLPDDLARSVGELAQRAGLPMIESPVVEIVATGEIPRGRVSVAAQYVAQETAPIGATEEISADELRQASFNPNRVQAFLILEGRRTVPLNRPVISVERALDNDLIIDDMRVSRHHAQLRLRGGYYVVYDTGSSGGTAVNGERIAERQLQAGDVINLAGYSVVYGEDAPLPPEPPVRLEDTPLME